MKENVEIIKSGAVYRVTKGSFRYSGWPSVCADENGVLYAAASSFRMGHVCPFGKTALFKSENSGENWSCPAIVNDSCLDDRDTGILYLGNGRILITRFSHPAEVYENDYRKWIEEDCGEAGAAFLNSYKNLSEEERMGGSWVMISGDYGTTFSDCIRVPVSSPHGPALLSDGRLLYVGKEMYSYGAEKEKTIAAYISEDGGYTWKKQGDCENTTGLPWDRFHEPHQLETENGDVLVFIRAEGKDIYHGFSMYKCFSHDAGKTFTAWESMEESGSPPHLMKLPGGAVLCTFCQREKPYSVKGMISRDGGKTFGESFVLDDRSDSGDMGYPASVMLPDGDIMTVYYKHYSEDGKSFDPWCSVCFTRWRLK